MKPKSPKATPSPKPGEIDPEIKVTKIGKRWHCRMLIQGKVFDEMSCDNSLDIGWCCREMLRWHCKLGGHSSFARAARKRHSESRGLVGKVHYLSRKYDLSNFLLTS